MEESDEFLILLGRQLAADKGRPRCGLRKADNFRLVVLGVGILSTPASVFLTLREGLWGDHHPDQ